MKSQSALTIVFAAMITTACTYADPAERAASEAVEQATAEPKQIVAWDDSKFPAMIEASQQQICQPGDQDCSGAMASEGQLVRTATQLHAPDHPYQRAVADCLLLHSTGNLIDFRKAGKCVRRLNNP